MSSLLLILTEQYLAEKRFIKETETIRLQEYYMLSSVKQVELLLKEGNMPETGILNYKYGEVAFQKQTFPLNIEEVTFRLQLNSGEKALGIGQYDKEKGLMVKWTEKN